MLDPSYFRAPKNLKIILRPTLLPQNKILDHNWADIFLFPTFSLMRFYFYPQSHNILTNFIPPRLTIIEFIYQLLIV